MADLLFELGCEELPPTLLCTMKQQLTHSITSLLETNEIPYDQGTFFIEIGPRRFFVYVPGLPTKTQKKYTVVKGPNYNHSLSEVENNASNAVIGFARSQNILPAKLEIKNGRYYAKKVFPATAISIKLVEILKISLKRLVFPKVMRWGWNEYSFIRPVRWAMLVFNKKVIKSTFYGVPTNAISYGHKFISNHTFRVTDLDSYLRGLKKGKVVLSYRKKYESIQSALKRRSIKASESLIDEVANMVEYPLVLTGEFDKKFMKLPSRLRQEVLQSHQRYFPYTSSNKFAFVANGDFSAVAQKNIIAGNQRVVKPRLEDAQFFLEGDIKNSSALIAISKTKTKTKNLEKTIALIFATMKVKSLVDFTQDELLQLLIKAKADLSSNVVAELPSLQGIVSSFLFNYQNKSLKDAVADQYLPESETDPLPRNHIGLVLATIDKFDEIFNLFEANKLATSKDDPFGTRRLALGLIRLLLAKKNPLSKLSLTELLKNRFSNDDSASQLHKFIINRFVVMQTKEDNQCIRAVPVAYTDNLLGYLNHSIKISSTFSSKVKLESIKATLKRLKNITNLPDTKVDVSQYQQKVSDWNNQNKYSHRLDKGLYNLIIEYSTTGNHRLFLKLNTLLADYFENILVKSGDELQYARIDLLSLIQIAIEQFAALSKI